MSIVEKFIQVIGTIAEKLLKKIIQFKTNCRSLPVACKKQIY